MPDDKGAPSVISLRDAREQREHQTGHEAHENGDAFAFMPYEFEDEDLGLIEGDKPITVLLDPDALTGVAMSREHAIALGVALIGAAHAMPEARAPEVEPLKAEASLNDETLVKAGYEFSRLSFAWFKNFSAMPGLPLRRHVFIIGEDETPEGEWHWTVREDKPGSAALVVLQNGMEKSAAEAIEKAESVVQRTPWN